jgi:hypothetical protein
MDHPSNVPFPVNAVALTSIDQRPLAVQPSTPVNGWEELKVPVIGVALAAVTVDNVAPPAGTKQVFEYEDA